MLAAVRYVPWETIMNPFRSYTESFNGRKIPAASPTLKKKGFSPDLGHGIKAGVAPVYRGTRTQNRFINFFT